MNAIPSILNFGGPVSGNFTRTGGQLQNNQYFETLARQGFNIRVLQSEYLDFCKPSSVVECTTYWSPSLAPIRDSTLSRQDRTSLILANFLYLSDYLVYVSKKFDTDLLRKTHFLADSWAADIRRRGRGSSLVAMQALNVFIGQLGDAKPGEAYFAHILLPHHPYAFDSECRLLPKDKWRFRWPYGSQKLMHQGHEQQLRCVQKKVGEALEAIGIPPGRSKEFDHHHPWRSRIADC